MYKISLRLFSSILLISLFGSLVTGCGQKDGQKEVTPVELATTDVDLKGEELIMGSPFLHRVGKYLVIADLKTDSVISIIDTETNTNLGSYFHKGQGPEEYGNITLLGRAANSQNEFLISDPAKRQLCRLTLADQGGKFSVVTTPVNTPDSNFWAVDQLANRQFVTSNGYDNYTEMITLHSPEGKFIGRTGERIIPSEYKKYGPVDLTAAYQYTLYPSPDGKRLAAVGGGYNARFYQLQGDSLVLTATIYDPEAEPEYVFSDRYEGVKGESKKPWGFTRGVASEKGVYIINSDQPFCDDNSWIDNQLLFFDWEGNLLGDYRLDRKINDISAPGPDGKMYATVVDDSDPLLVTITLPD